MKRRELGGGLQLGKLLPKGERNREKRFGGEITGWVGESEGQGENRGGLKGKCQVQLD